MTIEGEAYEFSEEGFAASSNCQPNRLGTFHALLQLVGDSGDLVKGSLLDLTLVFDPSSNDKNETDMIFVSLRNLDEPSDLNYEPGWLADGAYTEQIGLPSGVGQVDSYTIDGSAVSGTATFISNETSSEFLRGNADSVESVQGTFSVTCATG